MPTAILKKAADGTGRGWIKASATWQRCDMVSIGAHSSQLATFDEHITAGDVTLTVSTSPMSFHQYRVDACVPGHSSSFARFRLTPSHRT